MLSLEILAFLPSKTLPVCTLIKPRRVQTEFFLRLVERVHPCQSSYCHKQLQLIDNSHGKLSSAKQYFTTPLVVWVLLRRDFIDNCSIKQIIGIRLLDYSSRTVSVRVCTPISTYSQLRLEILTFTFSGASCLFCKYVIRDLFTLTDWLHHDKSRALVTAQNTNCNKNKDINHDVLR